MEQMYKEIFNASSIYDMLFINVVGVLEYSSLSELNDNNPEMAKTWVKTVMDNSEEAYQLLAVDYPEFCKIVGISYGHIYFDNGLQRNIKRIVNDNEYLVLGTFFSDLANMDNKIICGDNIINYDIPLLIKRFLINKSNFPDGENKLPKILKNVLFSKPWDSKVIDTRLAWKFNGFNTAPKNTQELYCNFLGLKKTVELMDNNKISNYYHTNQNNENKLLDIGLQSATKVNISMQLINLMRDV